MTQMRCVGAEKPPCTRCLKSGRECLVLPPNRQKSRTSVGDATHVQRTEGIRQSHGQGTGVESLPIGAGIPGMLSPESSGSSLNWPRSLDLPSIFSTSAMTATSPSTTTSLFHDYHTETADSHKGPDALLSSRMPGIIRL